jgi:hypothetical protein
MLKQPVSHNIDILPPPYNYLNAGVDRLNVTIVPLVDTFD